MSRSKPITRLLNDAWCSTPTGRSTPTTSSRVIISPGIHPGFFQAIEFEHFETTAHDNLVRMTAPPREGLFYKGKWLWMWPNWTLSLFDGGMNTSRINPISENRTELIYNFYFADTSDAKAAAREDTIARNLAVIEEDFEICLETQKNYATGGYSPGPLSPRHEQGVAWFQNRIAETLAGGSGLTLLRCLRIGLIALGHQCRLAAFALVG